MAATEANMMKTIFTRRINPVTETASAAVIEFSDEFSDIYREYLKPVYAFVAYRVYERTLAEDITSKVFEKAWRSFASFNPDRARLPTWLFTIARNCVIDHYRRAGRTDVELELNENTPSGGEAEPEPMLQALEVRRELQTALESLDSRDCEVVALKFGGAMTNREIAALLEISESNVGTILCRSLRKLQILLEGGIKND